MISSGIRFEWFTVVLLASGDHSLSPIKAGRMMFFAKNSEAVSSLFFDGVAGFADRHRDYLLSSSHACVLVGALLRKRPRGEAFGVEII